MKRERYSVDAVAKALRATSGIYIRAAKLLGCDRETVAEYVRRHKRLQSVLREVVEGDVDLAESVLQRKIREGNMTAVIFYLKTKGKQRGYIERAEVTGENGQPLAAGVVVTPALARTVMQAAFGAVVPDAATQQANGERLDSSGDVEPPPRGAAGG